MPAFIMTGSTIMPATWPRCASRSLATLARSLNWAISVRLVIASGMPDEDGTLSGRSLGPASASSGMTETCTESW